VDRRTIIEVLTEVFGRSIRYEDLGRWIKVPCFLSPWTHERGTDSKPSGGISVHPDKTSVYSCFTCGNAAPFHVALRRYAEFSGDHLDDLLDELEEGEYLGALRLPTWEELVESRVPQPLPELDPAIFMGLYDPAAGHPYVVDRGITDETCRQLMLMVDPQDPADGHERILFPVFGPEGKLHGLSGRATGEAKLKVRDYHGLQKARCLLGIHLINPSIHRYVLVVEGLFDYANAWGQGEPAVAVMHSTMTEEQAELLRDVGLPVYLFYDNDDAGKKGVKTAADLLRHHVPTMKVRYPDIWIEDDGEAEGGHYVKDPGELLSEEFKEMREDAVLA
jgi:hypothetical protein